jgi:hypothetical protein
MIHEHGLPDPPGDANHDDGLYSTQSIQIFGAASVMVSLNTTLHQRIDAIRISLRTV